MTRRDRHMKSVMMFRNTVRKTDQKYVPKSEDYRPDFKPRSQAIGDEDGTLIGKKVVSIAGWKSTVRNCTGMKLID